MAYLCNIINIDKEMRINSVLIADDHELVLTGVSKILNDRFSIDEICMFTQPQDVISIIKKRPFDLYILDIEMGEVSGFDLIEIIQNRYPNARILICTMHEEIWYINRLLTSKVKGVLLKRSSWEMLEQAVITVMEGKQFLCPRFLQIKEIQESQKQAQKKNYQLTPTERTVLKHIVDGYKSKEIADLLFVTEDTIEGHRKNLFAKLGTRNVAQLVAAAIRLHLVD